MSGFEKSTYTQMPNSLFEIMKDMSECELKVVLFICRLTFGYHRDEVRISTRKIAEGIGMNTASVDKGGDAAVARGLLEKVTDGNKTTIWRALVRDSEFESRPGNGDSNSETPNNQGDSNNESVATQKVNRLDSKSESLLGVKESIKQKKEIELNKDPFFVSSWDTAKEYLEGQIIGRAGFADHVQNTKAINYEDGILEVEAERDSIPWLESRIQKTAERYLVGVMNSEVSVQFVYRRSDAN